MLRKSEEALREMQENVKPSNIHIMGIPEGKEEQRIENLFEKVMMENFPNLMREKVTQIQETQRIPIKRTQRGSLQDTSKLKWQSSKTKRES